MHDPGHTDCRQMFEAISPYLDRELDESSCHELAQHMAHCEPCMRYVASIRATRDALKTLGRGDEMEPESADELLKECLFAIRNKLGDNGPARA